MVITEFVFCGNCCALVRKQEIEWKVDYEENHALMETKHLKGMIIHCGSCPTCKSKILLQVEGKPKKRGEKEQYEELFLDYSRFPLLFANKRCEKFLRGNSNGHNTRIGTPAILELNRLISNLGLVITEKATEYMHQEGKKTIKERHIAQALSFYGFG